MFLQPAAENPKFAYMPVRSLFPGTQDWSPPRSFQSLPAGGHGRALASSQRVTSSWLPLWTSSRPKELTSCLLRGSPCSHGGGGPVASLSAFQSTAMAATWWSRQGPRFQSASDKQLAAPVDIEPPKGADVLPPSRQPLQPWRWWSSRLPLRFPKHSDGDTVISIMADASSPWADASCRRRGPLARCSRCAGCGDASREPASAGHRGSRTCQSGHFFRALRTRALLDRSNRCQLVVTAGPSLPVSE